MRNNKSLSDIRKTRWDKKRKKKLVFIGSISLILLLGICVYFYFQFTNFKHVKIDQSDQALGIESPTPPSSQSNPQSIEQSQKEVASEEIVNIALFGVDRRNENDRGRSDAMIIATLDLKHKKVKLTSLMRDLYVPVDGHGYTKLNHAYAYGGAELAIKTINQNFGTNIRNYVTVDFFALEAVIDAIGGVEIDVKPNEVKYVNEYMKETAQLQNKEMIPLTASGKQTLNGMQAVSYARIRAVGNGDFERTERQRLVLSAMLDKVKSKGATAIPKLLFEVTPHIETSLSRGDILPLAYEFFKQQPLVLEQERFPMDGDWKGATINGSWYMRSDLSLLKEQITSYLNDDIHPKETSIEMDEEENKNDVISSRTLEQY